MSSLACFSWTKRETSWLPFLTFEVGSGSMVSYSHALKCRVTLFCIWLLLGAQFDLGGMSPCFTFSAAIILSLKWIPCTTFSPWYHTALLFYLAILSLQPVLTSSYGVMIPIIKYWYHTVIMTSLSMDIKVIITSAKCNQHFPEVQSFSAVEWNHYTTFPTVIILPFCFTLWSCPATIVENWQ